jgi:glutaredoxin/glutathione-dependent peroxiredoxin
MTIQIGEPIPNVTLKRLGNSGMEDLAIGDYLQNKKVILFATPGAFTPTCAQKHLPGYVAQADALKSQGIDEIICVSVNDPFVMKHWGETAQAEGKVTMIPDGNGEFVEALGLVLDGRGFGLGKRAQRFSMLIENGIVKDLQVEPAAGNVELSGAEACLIRLKQA